ncbi:HAD-IA family hydrolase [Prochlorococcus marinus]|uniref:HAD family hydrolase n=1 Tax=Prochlorococcus marinus XMU1408 TaxID=2213228 RepID=A0A318R6C7_PROMR|nr:HAD-IA family hydrolase [Prochlorococcus marinus]MBW3041987.1 HAD family hydrolase [Prochlorococcus marinus str. XMU1408]PYE03112.1 HAD family hydrolase [Prochlorococcus marinus XMU1408]
MNKLSAVFWDVDGTLADTELCGHRVAFNLAFKDFDLNWYWDKSKYLDLLRISGGLNRIINYRNEIYSDITDDLCVKIQSRKAFHYKELIDAGEIKVREGVYRLIHELAVFNVEQFIVTTSGRNSLEPFLHKALNSYLNYFSKIITYEDVINHKPFPDAYNLAVKLSQNSNLNCIAIEDSNVGVEAAKAANINCLMTLPPWSNNFQNITDKATACVDGLGNDNNCTKLFYGKPLISNYVDFAYLNKLNN